MGLKGKVIRTLRRTKILASWISQETWQLADRQAALQQAQRVGEQEVRQARWKFQRSFQGNKQRPLREAGEAIETFWAADKNH